MLKTKKDYLQFIKDFSKIHVTNICEELKINRSNILNGTASEETIKLLYDEINKRLELLQKNMEKDKSVL